MGKKLGISLLLVSLAAAAPARADDDAAITSRLREASALRDAGKYGDAAKKLAKIDEPDFAAPLGLARTRLLRADKQPDEAAHTAEASAAQIPASEIRAHLYAELAQIYLSRDDLASAEQAQHAAADATHSAEYAAQLANELARAFESHGRTAEALAMYTRVWQGYPLSGAAETAFSRATALAATTGTPPPEPSVLVGRADRLRESFRCDAALPLYESLLARSDTKASHRPSLERGRADCLFMARRYGDAVDAYRALAKRDPKDFEARFQAARALARSGAIDPAVAELEKLEKTKDELQRARVRALLATVLEDREPARALAELRQLERQTAAPNLASDARWSLAWADLRGGGGLEAAPLLDKMAQGTLDDVEVQRARYWRGVAHFESSDEARRIDGAEELKGLARDIPLSYYGMLASERVGGSPIEKSLVGPRASSPEAPALRRARLFLDGGFPEIAADEIESYADDARLDRDARIATARLLHRTGDSYRALKLIDDGFGPTLEQGIDPAWREAWELAWPRAFGQWVSGATHEFSFDPALVWAIMREESAYRAQVSSPAGALGLMQLMPQTGGRVAGELGLSGFVTERLYDPETNIRLGTYYLRSLFERFDGSRALTIASYNAGPEAVGRWLEKNAQAKPDAFVESVSYGETRRYLRRVLRSYRVYQLLYGDAVKAVPQPLPPQPASVAAPPATDASAGEAGDAQRGAEAGR
ncbi:MAG TPA: transglycosylase SLT domain-containing protein [Myxococcota bacterium]|nr:transglycosylase SLT domain-containing protein [Myxococcota bacterium]